MTDTELCDAVGSELSELFEGISLNGKGGVLRPVRVFMQYIPQAKGLSAVNPGGLKSYGESDYEANFPCIVVRHTGRSDSWNGSMLQGYAGIRLLCGVYDDAPECTGWRDILMMQERIRARFMQEMVIARKYLLRLPVRSRLLDAEDWPVYFGETDMEFHTGVPVMGKDFAHKRAVSA